MASASGYVAMGPGVVALRDWIAPEGEHVARVDGVPFMQYQSLGLEDREG
ncbi:hypothetical protein ACIHDR_31885 [Nocardia sp. NPDC052278]